MLVVKEKSLLKQFSTGIDVEFDDGSCIPCLFQSYGYNFLSDYFKLLSHNPAISIDPVIYHHYNQILNRLENLLFSDFPNGKTSGDVFVLCELIDDN